MWWLLYIACFLLCSAIINVRWYFSQGRQWEFLVAAGSFGLLGFVMLCHPVRDKFLLSIGALTMPISYLSAVSALCRPTVWKAPLELKLILLIGVPLLIAGLWHSV